MQVPINMHICHFKEARISSEWDEGITPTFSVVGISTSVCITATSKQRYQHFLCVCVLMALFQLSHPFLPRTHSWLSPLQSIKNVWLMFWPPHMVFIFGFFLCILVTVKGRKNVSNPGITQSCCFQTRILLCVVFLSVPIKGRCFLVREGKERRRRNRNPFCKGKLKLY